LVLLDYIHGITAESKSVREILTRVFFVNDFNEFNSTVINSLLLRVGY